MFSELVVLSPNVTIWTANVGTALSIRCDIVGWFDAVSFNFDGIERMEKTPPYTMGGNTEKGVEPILYLSAPGQKLIIVTVLKSGVVVEENRMAFTIV
jgi:hypothetical protein